MKKIIFILCVLIFNASRTRAQDQAFLNTNQSLVNLNPSFAGSNGLIRSQFSYNSVPATRDWSGRTAVLNSTDAYIKPINGGIAFSALSTNNGNGIYKSQVYSLAYAQYFSLMDGQVKIVPSVQLGYAENRIDLERAGFKNPNTTYFGELPSARQNYFDLSSGILVNYKNKLYAGVSAFHLNHPSGNFSTNRVPCLYNYHLSYNLKISERMRIQFQASALQDELGLDGLRAMVNMVSFSHLVTGIGWLNEDTGVLNAGYRNNYYTLLFTCSAIVVNEAGTEAYRPSYQFQASFNLRNKEHRRSLTSFESW